MAHAEGLLLGRIHSHVAALGVVGPLGEATNRGFPRWDHRARVVVVRLLPEEGVGLHVEGEVAVVACKEKRQLQTATHKIQRLHGGRGVYSNAAPDATLKTGLNSTRVELSYVTLSYITISFSFISATVRKFPALQQQSRL